uniref:Uncharacterized protein n=1 Tax=Caenorhabditis japonica TaxID=281687 RepID=A0A8R1E589_CAEJA
FNSIGYGRKIDWTKTKQVPAVSISRNNKRIANEGSKKAFIALNSAGFSKKFGLHRKLCSICDRNGTDDYEELPDLDASDGSNGADKTACQLPRSGRNGIGGLTVS